MDWGVRNFATLSDGEIIDPCQPLKKFLPVAVMCRQRIVRRKQNLFASSAGSPPTLIGLLL
jgi:hypothetical protein